MTKKATKKQLAVAPFTEYEKVRANTIMRNNRMFQSLGIGNIVSMIRRSNGSEGSTVTSNDCFSDITQGSGSEYSPTQDEDNHQEDEPLDTIVENEVKVGRLKKKCVSRRTSKKTTQEVSSKMAPGRVMAVPPGGSKRMLELSPRAPPRFTRSKVMNGTANEEMLKEKSLSSSLPLDDLFLPSDDESSRHTDVRTLAPTEASNQQTSMRMDLSPVASTRAMTEERNMQMVLSPAVHQQQPNQPSLDADDDDEGTMTLVKPKDRRGAGLERMTKSLGTKVKIHIAEGAKRPENPLQAAKLASEAGLIARSHTPILPHFKEYKKDPNLMKDFIGKVAANFDMDTESVVVKEACFDMLQKRAKNRRYCIKKKHFDNKPANEVSIKSPEPDLMSDEEWQGLVKLWSTGRHKETCISNKNNRSKVQFQQKTGSRCYRAHIYAIKEERKGQELTAVDYFKVTHNSKKGGYSEPVQNAIAKMEEMMNAVVPEGEEPKSATSVVAQVLTNGSTFLMNAGLKSTGNKVSSNAAVAEQVTDLQGKLARSEQQGEVMREELALLKKKTEEDKAARDLEVSVLKKKAEETDARFAHLMRLFSGVPS